MSELDTSEVTITRGKVLKRAAIIGAAAWSVPFFASTASADASPDGAVANCVDFSGPNGTPSPECDFQVCKNARNGTVCYCYPGAKGAGASSGCCVCAGNEFCSQTPACNTNADCPRGWKCTFNFCGQTCVPPCGLGIAGGLATTGKTAAGN